VPELERYSVTLPVELRRESEAKVGDVRPAGVRAAPGAKIVALIPAAMLSVSPKFGVRRLGLLLIDRSAANGGNEHADEQNKNDGDGETPRGHKRKAGRREIGLHPLLSCCHANQLMR
jgi:hypothetical protein